MHTSSNDAKISGNEVIGATAGTTVTMDKRCIYLGCWSTVEKSNSLLASSPHSTGLGGCFLIAMLLLLALVLDDIACLPSNRAFTIVHTFTHEATKEMLWLSSC